MPQGLLQSYIALLTSNFDGLFAISVSGSFISLAWALVSFESNQVEKFRQKKIKFFSIYFLSLLFYRLTEVTSRLLLISFFGMFFRYWILIILAVDYVLLVGAYFITTLQVKSKFKLFALFVYVPIWMFIFWDWFLIPFLSKYIFYLILFFKKKVFM